MSKRNTIDSHGIDESDRSLQEDFLRNNQEFVEKGLETCFKTLNTNLYNTINSSFSNFNNDYEHKLEKNREVHENAIKSLTQELNLIREKQNRKKLNADLQEESIQNVLNRMVKLKIYSKVFRHLQFSFISKKYKNLKKFIIIDKYFQNKRKKNILNSWRNITNSMSKGRIKLKYGKIFNDKSEEIRGVYLKDIKYLEEILQKLEVDIRKEITERK